ncbi:MAG TPA: hypothetical protein VGE42_11640, partial [Candidatus Dormibacteraeota bacterium]
MAWWLAAGALSALVVLVSIVLGNHRRDDPSLDILDEGPHYAYVVALRAHHLPAWGDTLDQGTLRLEDCFSLSRSAPHNCSRRDREPSGFDVGGYSFEAQQPPLGYLPYALTATPDAAPRDAIAAAREGGKGWTVVAGVLLLAVAWAEGTSLLGLVVLQATCLLSPVFLHAASTVTNDSAGVAAGALALLGAAVMRGRRRPSLGFAAGLAVGIVIGMLKGVYVVAPLALVVAALLLERPWRPIRQAWRDILRRTACVLGMLVGTAGAYLGWMAWQEARASVPSSVVLHALLGFRP